VTEVPVLVVHELEVREGELLLNEGRELVEDGFCPVAHEDDELVDVPSHAAAGNLRVVALKLGGFVLGLGLEVLLGPNLTVQLRVVDEGQSFVGCFLYLFGCQFLLANAKEYVIFGVVPKDSDGRHGLVEGAHVSHLGVMFAVGETCHFQYFNIERRGMRGSTNVTQKSRKAQKGLRLQMTPYIYYI